MSNEAIITLRKYFFDNNEKSIQFRGNKERAQEIVDFLSYGKYYIGDSPDMAIILNDECLLMEHFEFDCFKNK